MGFRFRRSIKIVPGVRVNFSKTGISTSLGGRGATVNIRGNKLRTTVGLPGSGLSYSETHSLQPNWTTSPLDSESLLPPRTPPTDTLPTPQPPPVPVRTHVLMLALFAAVVAGLLYLAAHH
jgi:hypothetical protein